MILMMITLLIILLVAVHEAFYYIILYHWIDLPVVVTSSSSSSSSSSTQSNNATSIAIVSLHRGMKFAGILGTWLTQNKAAYATAFQQRQQPPHANNNYAYFHQDYFASLLLQVQKQQQQQNLLETLDPWQEEVYHRRVKFDKLRFLLYICKQFPNLEYILWLDADAVIVEPAVDIRERVAIFDQAFISAQQQQQQTHAAAATTTTGTTTGTTTTTHSNTNKWCFVWAQDMISPNSGVLLLRNSVALQSFLKTSLHTYNPQQRFMDQASMLTVLKQQQQLQQQQQATKNNTTQKVLTCTPLLLEANNHHNNKRTVVTSTATINSRLLQSRVRGPPWLLYQPGDWIVHLPNHNRWELVWALYNVSKRKKGGNMK